MKQPALGLRLKRALLRARLALAASTPFRRAYLARRFAYLAPHIHQADPSVAADIASGQVVLAGRSLLCGSRSPFHLAPPSDGFAEALHGFSWLAHCDASENPLVRAHARTLVRDFLDLQERAPAPVADLPGVMARRVIAWVTHSALLSEGQDITWYRRLLTQLARDGARLAVYARREDIGVARLEAALGLAFHALALENSRGTIPRAERMLDLALASLMAPDGATHDRDCGTVALVAADLVALLALYRIRQLPVPPGISAALADMVSFLRLVQHPDGGLMRMNGGGRIPRDLVNEVIRSRRGHASLLSSAVETGFERVENNHAVLIADAGMPPRRSCAGRAGASALAFEFSTREERIIVSCGVPPGADRETARLYRSAAAHSSVLFAGGGLAGLNDVPIVTGAVETRLDPLRGSLAPLRARSAQGEALTLAHRGFLEAHGYIVERQFSLPDALAGLLGRDRFIDQGDKGTRHPVTLTFHLSARVEPVSLDRRDAILLRLPGDQAGSGSFLFEAPGHDLILEESRTFEAGASQARTHCIVIETEIAGTTEIVWRILPAMAGPG